MESAKDESEGLAEFKQELLAPDMRLVQKGEEQTDSVNTDRIWWLSRYEEVPSVDRGSRQTRL